MKTQLITKSGKLPLVINIRCDDECNNGHDSFSITGYLYRPFERGDRKDADWKVFDGKNYTIDSCGRIHDTILKAKKELKTFVDLHLSDGNGAPMYAVENGYYYYSAKYPSSTTWFKALQDHLRIDNIDCLELVSTLDSLPADKRKEAFISYVDKQRPRWKEEANQAKKQLQQLIDTQAVSAQ